ncbi:hypothetical protein BTN50_1403 [Candidatus Enterovibrio altilux]|uniref:Uncharacterized protein n=1 Tax=Candidatus Enterovibrio altilux TaxID=1927128 RepID=A0A291BA53_9GAMM|nr:hypothetical protein BTN50_1403 [Candidatus Enterovibrio luxaltus]
MRQTCRLSSVPCFFDLSFFFTVSFDPRKINGSVLYASFIHRLERDVNRFDSFANAWIVRA